MRSVITVRYSRVHGEYHDCPEGGETFPARERIKRVVNIVNISYSAVNKRLIQNRNSIVAITSILKIPCKDATLDSSSPLQSNWCKACCRLMKSPMQREKCCATTRRILTKREEKRKAARKDRPGTNRCEVRSVSTARREE